MTAPDLQARMAKRIGIALVAVMGAWLLVQEIGAQYGWPPRFAVLADFAALAGFLWVLVATYRLWRLGQANGPTGRR